MLHDPRIAEEADLPAEELLRASLTRAHWGRVALVSSFGAEAAVLLHMVARIDPATPVIFNDTGKLFAETLAYQRELAVRLGLRDLRVARPDPADLARADPAGDLHRRAPDACCHVRKVAPLERALSGFDACVTGRKRYQSATRSLLPQVESDGRGRLRLNPLAAWRREDAIAYLLDHELPIHPLVDKGYVSLGCAPCTTPAGPGEAPRAGRWRGLEKDECGIHFAGGRPVRGAAERGAAK